MDINTLIQNTHHQLVVFLEGKLFDICSEDWWGNCVRLKLTYAQEQILDEKNIDCLEKLDFAALLRVLNKNWWDLKAKFNLSREGMTLVNEVMNIRNRYAHMSIEGVDLNDRLRDCDTLARFLALIDADKKNIEEANKYHKKLIKQVASGYGDDESEENDEVGGQIPKNILSEANIHVKLDQGVPESFIRPDTAVKDKQIMSAMEKAVFIGIDFGTSITVVSMMEKNNDQLISEPIPIVQWDKEGREVKDHLLPTCIAWHNKKLLVGRGALELKQRSQAVEGRNLWTEFKMKQGVNTGPFPHTVLTVKNGGLVIEDPQDAVRIFFTFLQQAVEEYMQSKKLPSRIYYSVSVPASFEANQRQDLIKSISDSGIQTEELSLIDEPNAAFLSHLFSMEKGKAGESFLDGMTERPRVVSVFDFGAGTCDISILKIAIKDNLVSSQNLAISEFMALGGRDIDHAIVTKVLLPQLCGNSKPEDIFSTEELKVLVIPKLSAHAEKLKIQCSKLIDQRGLKKVEDLIRNDKLIVGKSIEPIKVRKKSWKLDKPTISLSQFGEIMQPFLSSTKVDDKNENENENYSVLLVLQNAMDKADLSVTDLDMVLFIGGSCENLLVRTAIEKYVGRFVDCVTPRDLRSHVSQGSAIHSLFAHGLGAELIRPILGDPIFILTKDNVFERVLDSGTPIPSEVPTITEFYANSTQQYVELPFYSGSQQKEIGVIKIKIERGRAEDKIKVSCVINHEKLLDVKVTINGNIQSSEYMNPLSNSKQSSADLEYLIAVKDLNESRLKGGPERKPTVEAVQGAAIAAQNAKKWREAAEYYINAERLDSDIDHSTSICYSYAMAGDNKKSDKWSEKAFNRNPDNSVAAYNLALAHKQDRNISKYEELMLKSLELDSDNTATLSAYGHYLIEESEDQSGLKMINKAFDIFDDELNNGYLNESDYARLRKTANTLGKKSILRKLDNYQKAKEDSNSSFDEENLVILVDKQEKRQG